MKMRINYHQVIQQANKISDESREIKKNINKLETMMQEIRTAWKSPASETFLNKCEQLKQEMLQSQRRTEQVAATIKNVANRIRQEDEQMAEKARLLNSN